MYFSTTVLTWKHQRMNNTKEANCWALETLALKLSRENMTQKGREKKGWQDSGPSKKRGRKKELFTWIVFVPRLGTILIIEDISNFKLLFTAGSWYLIKLPFPWFRPSASHFSNAINSVISTAVTTWAIVCNQRSWTSKRSLLISGIRLGSGKESHKLFVSHIIPVPKLSITSESLPAPSRQFRHVRPSGSSIRGWSSVWTGTLCYYPHVLVPQLNYNCRVSEEPASWKGWARVTSSGVGN